MKYNPNCWEVLIFTNKQNGDEFKKVLAGWSGSYLYGESWKLGSAINKTNEFTDRWEFECESGSTYVCTKDRKGFNMYLSSIYSSFEKDVEGSDKVSMKIATQYD